MAVRGSQWTSLRWFFAATSSPVLHENRSLARRSQRQRALSSVGARRVSRSPLDRDEMPPVQLTTNAADVRSLAVNDGQDQQAGLQGPVTRRGMGVQAGDPRLCGREGFNQDRSGRRSAKHTGAGQARQSTRE